jgi:hypothetical protein
MHSITTVVKVKYGLHDEPEPLFQCPVVVDPKVLHILQGTSSPVESIVREAACAVELVSRFEAATRYVDFASRLALPVGDLPIALRVQLVRGHIGTVARIDFSDADCRLRHRSQTRRWSNERPRRQHWAYRPEG